MIPELWFHHNGPYFDEDAPPPASDEDTL
jgi:hypothetical protein